VSVKGYMIDVQGTLISDGDKSPIPGSLEALRRLREEGVPFVLVTNNTKQESEAFRTYLQDLGFGFEEGQYLDPLMVLTRRVPPAPVTAYGAPNFLEVLKKEGYTLNCDAPEAVLVAIRPDYTNDDYAGMIEAVLGGAKLIGMHETSLYVKNGRRYPGVGAILKMVAFATGRAYEVVGKPSDAFYAEALERLRCQGMDGGYEAVEMISDDLIGDLAGAKRLGMRTTLVLSGKVASVAEIPPSARAWADRVANDIGVVFGVERRRTA